MSCSQILLLSLSLLAGSSSALPANSQPVRDVKQPRTLLPLQLILQRPYYCDMKAPPGVKLASCSGSAEFCCPQDTTCWAGNGTEVMCALETRQIYPASKCDTALLAPQNVCGEGLCCGPYMTCAPGRGCVPDGVISGGATSLDSPICNATISEFQCGLECCSADQGEICDTRTGKCGAPLTQEAFPASPILSQQSPIMPSPASGHMFRPASAIPTATGSAFKTGPGLPPPMLAERAWAASSPSPSQDETPYTPSSRSTGETAGETGTQPTSSASKHPSSESQAPLSRGTTATAEPSSTQESSQGFFAVPTTGWMPPMDQFDNTARMVAERVGISRAATFTTVLVVLAVL